MTYQESVTYDSTIMFYNSPIHSHCCGLIAWMMFVGLPIGIIVAVVVAIVVVAVIVVVVVVVIIIRRRRRLVVKTAYFKYFSSLIIIQQQAKTLYGTPFCITLELFKVA